MPGPTQRLSELPIAYDAVIIGSGFGGAFSALALVEAGLRVLMLERGLPVARDEDDWDPRKILLEGRYAGPSPLQIRQYGARQPAPIYPMQMLGGNSVLYGGASLRLRPRDVETWPISYDDLEAHYTRAEDLLGVHGLQGEDPYEPPRSTAYGAAPPELTAPAKRIHEAATDLGWRPFRLPMAINFTDESRSRCVLCNTCDGFPCRIEAKNDLTATVLRLAVTSGLEIRPGAVVGNIEFTGQRARVVEGIDAASGESFRVEADRVVVAAGALGSPAILLRSGVHEISSGGDWIGRRLMRHCNAVLTGVFPFATNPEQLFHKQLCLTDFYEDVREELGTSVGTIQDIYTPSADVISHFAPFGLKTAAARFTRYMQNLLVVAEDDPGSENRVTLTAERDAYGHQIARIDHEYTDADLRRRDYLVGKARRILRQAGAWITRRHEIDSFSHGLGTALMGESPSSSALDANCRVWGTAGLWVVDGSCFVTSAGVNPSLTIAANALRVAPDIMAGQ
ncbi:MAG: GMC family oxidoreductase [Gemmatimonadetes bacterium]|nr:GMC family oxidoreductase [Gemmatimonadota bacterium]MBT5591159.1 GMC family oxidoreductase [Gemmatimonadota bacterium]MBT5960154.1 GMC family oxidoreductase [Gemmatimonadota bacterium]MBT6631160.1 GMC family oxidoreductase [Gemmatimonadota bacterium]MBT7452291.1 GMC family oxidoreductase [Gemmatimonadota bacterium]